MEESSTKKTLLVIVGLAVLVIAGLLFYKMYFDGAKSGTPTTIEEPKLNIEYYPQEEIPGDIPKDMPFEEGAPLLRNEMLSVNADERVQYARGYYSKKSIKENYNIYLDYFKENKYSIVNNVLEENFASIGALKGTGGGLQVSISKNVLTNDITVQVVSYR